MATSPPAEAATGEIGRGAALMPRLTRAGRTVGGGALLLAAAGGALGYRELTTIAVAGGLALLAALPAGLVPPRAEVRRTVTPDRVVRGEPAQAHVSAGPAAGRLSRRAGRGRRAGWGPAALRLRDRVDDRVVEVRVPRAAVRAGTRTTHQLPTRRRGAVPVGPLGVVRTDPLGLVETEVQVGQRTTLWVHPRVHDIGVLTPGRQRDLEGPTHDTASGQVTFHALREYVTGDDLRLIHWRSTARTGALMVREQADPSRPHSTVVLDTHPGSYATEDCFESAVDAAASVVLASTARRFPVRLLTTSGAELQGRPGRAGPAGGTGLLDQLARLQLSDRGTLTELAPRLASRPGGHALVVVTGTGSTDASAPADAARSADAAAPGLALVMALRSRYLGLALVRFAPDAEPSAAWHDEVLRLDAPDAARFAALWRRAA